MIFYLHYILCTAGLCGTNLLLGVYLKAYSDATQSEIGILLMTFPFASIFIKPVFCFLADRAQAHKAFMITALCVMMIGFSPFVAIPFWPDFFTQRPRMSLYILILFCHIGHGGLGVAWALGDCLSMNMSQKTKVPYSRMRLTGTISWGVYGYIIGQINETPLLPRFVPSFLILEASVFVEIILLLFWKNEDFEMYDPMQDKQDSSQAGANKSWHENPVDTAIADSTPGSLAGSVRLNPKTAAIFRDVITADDMSVHLKTMERQQDKENNMIMRHESNLSIKPANKNDQIDCEKHIKSSEDSAGAKNCQMIIMKMIFKEDSRFIKYLILFTIFGILLSPMSFIFLSMEEVCKEKDCNFSELAGYVIISQATVETVSFWVLPWFLARVSWTIALSFSLVILLGRYCLYAYYYYLPGVSPYWAVVGEQGHGLAYGVFCTIMAEIALMFANQTRLFIPELRALGLLSDKKIASPEKIEMEETAIKMALRATMQALFGGFMEGLGGGFGSLLCGLVIDAFSYISLWKLFAAISLGTCVIHQIVELSRTRWSDKYKPERGSKAFDIRTMNQKLQQSTKA